MNTLAKRAENCCSPALCFDMFKDVAHLDSSQLVTSQHVFCLFQLMEETPCLNVTDWGEARSKTYFKDLGPLMVQQ